MMFDDDHWMAAAIGLAGRGRARTGSNPNVGCIIVNQGHVVGRGWTGSGGRPHAEANALAQAASAARGATVYVTLEPCAHISSRGPACAQSLIDAGVARVVAAIADPDLRTNGQGIAQLSAAGVITRCGVLADAARASMAGWLMQRERGRPYVKLKLATSADGCIALANGESRWITGDAARAHAHVERARSNMILIGRGTLEADAPRLDVRLAGLETQAPEKILLSRTPEPGWRTIKAPEDSHQLDAQYLMVEGGAKTAAGFIAAGLVDRILLYRAPIFIGSGRACLGDIGLSALDDAHGRWRLVDTRQLGIDTLDVYDAV
jgi:diaminohydroxyphosphoribosylaminopyrimidine deaminase / 5-amino-6-(5-phosphoribosylamino)uracil reductase